MSRKTERLIKAEENLKKFMSDRGVDIDELAKAFVCLTFISSDNEFTKAQRTALGYAIMESVLGVPKQGDKEVWGLYDYVDFEGIDNEVESNEEEYGENYIVKIPSLGISKVYTEYYD